MLKGFAIGKADALFVKCLTFWEVYEAGIGPSSCMLEGLFLTADRGTYCRTGSDYVVLGLLELVDLTSAVDSLDVGLGDI
jgi:hypothetical protein